MKIVLNNCFGGFSLSYEAMALYLYARNKEAFFYVDISSYDSNYTKTHKYERISLTDIHKVPTSRYIYCTTEDQGEVIDYFPRNVCNFNDIDRTDPTLISVVETMGSAAASGRFAELSITEIPDGTLYKIDYYNGMESIITQEDDDWILAQENKCSPDITAQIQNIWTTIKPDKGEHI